MANHAGRAIVRVPAKAPARRAAPLPAQQRGRPAAGPLTHLAEPGDLPIPLHVPIVRVGGVEQRDGQPERLPEAPPVGWVGVELQGRQQDDLQGAEGQRVLT